MAVWPARHGDDEVVPLTHADFEVSDRDSVGSALDATRPDVVINTTAYHKVDLVESTAPTALAVNAVGARNVAEVCRRLGATCVFLSTDYVFSGALRRPHTESDAVDPLSVYGVSKAAGEMLVRIACERHFIVRSSGLYGLATSRSKGGNFVETMLRLADSGKPIKVVSDQVLTPTPTALLAPQIIELVDTAAYGTYHATCQGECSWYEFALEIFRQWGVSPELSAQSTAESGALARRPPYSVLDNAGLRRLDIDRLPDWREGLRGYLTARRQALSGAPS
jgi:dTDP-4-dehydrorhamnose reductase